MGINRGLRHGLNALHLPGGGDVDDLDEVIEQHHRQDEEAGGGGGSHDHYQGGNNLEIKEVGGVLVFTFVFMDTHIHTGVHAHKNT